MPHQQSDTVRQELLSEEEGGERLTFSKTRSCRLLRVRIDPK